MNWTDEDEAKWQAAEAIRKALGGEEVETQCDEFNAPCKSLLNREPIDWTDPSISEEEVNFQWEELFRDDITTIEPKNNNITEDSNSPKI